MDLMRAVPGPGGGGPPAPRLRFNRLPRNFRAAVNPPPGITSSEDSLFSRKRDILSSPTPSTLLPPSLLGLLRRPSPTLEILYTFALGPRVPEIPSNHLLQLVLP